MASKLSEKIEEIVVRLTSGKEYRVYYHEEDDAWLVDLDDYPDNINVSPQNSMRDIFRELEE